MTQESITALQAKVALQQKKLDLIQVIDHIRDTVLDPTTMLANIVNILLDQLQADFCLLALLDRDTGEPEVKTINDRSQQLGQLGQAITRDLIKQVVQLDEITLWEAEAVLPPLSLNYPLHQLHLAAVPIILRDNERLGALLLARILTSFTPDEVELLKTAESQLDSAIIQGYTYRELQQHVKELKTIYRIDHIRDESPSFDEMLNAVLHEICQVIEAEVGFAMLYDYGGQRLELRAATHHDLFEVSTSYQLIIGLANQSLKQAKLLARNDLQGALRSILCMPLILNERIIGVLGVVNRYGPRGFNSEDRRLLHAIGSQMDTAIFENIEKRRLREVLGRSVDPRIMARLLDHPSADFLKGERSVLTVLYADLRGSTRLAEQTDPETLVGFINHYLGQMTDIILSHEGTLDKFVGDEVMALFGAPFPQADHALRAVRVALDMQHAHQTLMEIWQDRGVDAPPIGVGIATGELIVGEMGCPQRADYTVIGKAANLGSRICNIARPGEVLISQETFDLIQPHLQATPRTGMQFKGVERDVTIYHVTGVVG
jgi:adenylate cyclase